MFFVEDVMISEELRDARFGCKLNICKGGCCVEGDGGAPLEPEEAKWIKDNIEILLTHLYDEKSLTRVENIGPTYVEDGVEHVTILPKNGACVFLLEESKGFRQCLFEKLYLEGRTEFQKPISCHLFPLIFRQTKYHKILSFQRRNICLPSWNHGEHLLKNLEPALKRKFGNNFVSKLFEKLQFEE
ncbi:MAG: DUF3109 family protein [bacterium]|nr:DUF3109 family protein [bacterium]